MSEEKQYITDRLRRYSRACLAERLDPDFADAVMQASETAGCSWISTKERIPDEDCSTLVCTESGKVCTARFYAATRKWNGYAGKSAKYWMPLPAPPDVETGS